MSQRRVRPVGWPETFGKTRQELPLRIAGPPLRPVLGEASYGNVGLFLTLGSHVRSAGTGALNR